MIATRCRTSWDVDVTKLTPAQIYRYAVANLPKEFQEADCAMFYSGSHATSPGKVKVHLWFWLSKPINTKYRKLWLEAINVLAGLKQTEDSRAVDPAVGSPWQPIFCAAPEFRGAPDPVPERWHFIAGTTRDVLVPDREALEKVLAGKRPRPEGPEAAAPAARPAAGGAFSKAWANPTGSTRRRRWRSGTTSGSSARTAIRRRSTRCTTR